MAACRPLALQQNRNELRTCNYFKAFDTIFKDNVNDVADALIKVMIIFGINQIKAQTAKSLIIKAFTFYDNKRHRFDMVNKNGISRGDVLCKFQRKCRMSYMEALLAYTVLKRAVKAFYHATPDFSIRSPVTAAVALMKQEFIWRHAAARTNQLFEHFERVFSHAPHNYRKQVVNIYEELYKRMKSRVHAVLMGIHKPMEIARKEVIVAHATPTEHTSVLKENSQLPLLHKSESKEVKTKNIELNLPRCYQCNCPQLICDCKIELETGVLAIDCSQGPFKCQWIKVNNFDESAFASEQTQSHICPIDCATSEGSSESDSCDCCEEAECDQTEQSAGSY